MTRTLFVTPDITSETTQCRTLTIPDNKEWLGVFNKALLTMLQPYNWEQINDTDLTVDATIDAAAAMIDAFWATETCGTGCTLPDLDSPPFRLGVNGRFEMLNPDTGAWGTPVGEYAIPSTPTRAESTAEERKCAAAANAANVMKILYEAITDEIELGGNTLQVAAAMVAALVTAVGGWIAAPVYAIIQLGIALFAGMIEILQVLGADVWTADFDDKLKCALLTCATDTASVVTFDLACIREELTAHPDLFSTTWFQDYQLFAQILFLLETITMDGLNAAGATTGVASPNCEDCGVEWCYLFDFTQGLEGWTQSFGTRDSGGITSNSSGTDNVEFGIAFVGAEYINSVQFGWNANWTGVAPRIVISGESDLDPTLADVSGETTETSTTIYINATANGIYINMDRRVGGTQYWGGLRLEAVALRGTGTNPFGDSNCPL